MACKRDERDDVREKIRLEEELRNEQNRIQQEKLFAQAQEFMEKEKANNTNWRNPNNSYTSYTDHPSYTRPHDDFNKSSTDKSYLRAQEKERCINSKSSELARTYLTTHQCNEAKLTFEKVFLVYKYNATNQQTLVSGMENMHSLESASQYFKKAALLIHPDKNSHPLAETVFKKLRNSYETAKATLKMRQQQQYYPQSCYSRTSNTFTQQNYYYSTAAN